MRLNIETKIDPNHPDESPDPRRFASLVLNLLRREHFSNRVMIESFDWRSLQFVQQQAPGIPTVYLTQQSGPNANVYLDKPSAWTAGFDPATHGGTVPRAVKAAGGAIWSPVFTMWMRHRSRSHAVWGYQAYPVPPRMLFVTFSANLD